MRMQLNRNDPLDFGLDFGELDAMAESLWAGTAPEPELQAPN